MAATDSARRRRSAINRHFFAMLMRILVLIALTVIFTVPLLWMVSTALKPDRQVWANPPVWIPSPLAWENFARGWTALPFTLFLRNSVIVTFFSVLGTTMSSMVCAFSFARLRWPLRDFWFGMLVSTMMLPGVVTLIPTFILFLKLGWINSFKPLVIPPFFGSAFNIFLLRQFIMTIPIDFDEAARIDGCPTLRLLWQVVAPLCKPALATVVIFTFMGAWNDFMGPLIFMRRMDLYTMPVGLQFFKHRETSEPNLLMAMSLVIVAPCLIVFFSAQRYFLEGVTLTGLKG